MSIGMQGTNPQPSQPFFGTYVDPALTQLGTPVQDPNFVDPKPDRNSLGKTEVYDVAGTDHRPGEQGAAKPPHSPTHMAIEVVDGFPRARDYYRNGGMIDQDFINQG